MTSRCSSGFQFAQQCAHAARRVKVFHITFADWFQVDEHRRLVGEFVEARQRNPDAEPPGDCCQMHERVGRSAQRQQHAQRVSTDLW